MKTNLTIIALMALIFVSCNKDDEDDSIDPSSGTNGANGENISFNQPNTAGSYWVYQWYRVNYDGSYTVSSRIDSIYIAGDTLINDKIYTVKKGSWLTTGSNYTSILRDSSGYFVTPSGGVRFSYVNFSDTINSRIATEISVPQLSYYRKMFDNSTISVPAGEFSGIEARDYYFYESGQPVNSCGDFEIGFGSFYVDQIGLVKYQTTYAGPLYACTYFEEARLIRYYIAP
jgi:hypothetical protein